MTANVLLYKDVSHTFFYLNGLKKLKNESPNINGAWSLDQ